MTADAQAGRRSELRRNGTMCRNAAGAIVIIGLTLLAAACGSDGSSPRPTPTPSGTATQPTATPSVTPTSAPPTPSGVPVVTGMELSPGRATSVNRFEWIVVDSTPERVPRPRRAHIVLPPDAGPDAGPLPVLACPDGEPSDDGCDGELQVPLEVGETDWIAGERQSLSASGERIVQAAAYGPGGENVALVDASIDAFAAKIYVGPGPLFTGSVVVGDPGEQRVVAAVWRSPGPDYELLETPGFPDGHLVGKPDAAGWMAATTNDAEPLPVVLIPDGDGYAVQRLPLLPGARSGVARDVDDRRIVGWSDDGERSRAVVWSVDETGIAVELLPLPPGARDCESAVAISGARIVGRCRATNGASLPTVWTTDPGAADWRVEALLAPLVETNSVDVHDISGDLAVGTSSYQLGQGAVAMAWRLP